MKVKAFLIMALMAVPGIAAAQNTLTVAETTIPQNGGELKFNFTFAEENVYTSYQFKIVTPDGAVYDTDADNDVTCTLGACHTASHAATVHWNSTTSTLAVGVASMSSALLKGTSGELISIPLLGTEKAIGTVLTFSVEDITYIRQDGTKDKLDNLELNITVAAPADKRTLLDEASITAPTASSGAVDVRVKRTINANEWSTICLPFDMTEAQVKTVFGNDVQLMEFMEYEANNELTTITVVFDNANLTDDGLIANNPYIIKTSQDITEFTVDGVTIAPDEEGAVAEYTNGKTGSRKVVYGSFIGTYHAQTVVPQNSLFLSDNQFWYSTGLTKMKAFRAYFTFQDVLADVGGASSRINMTFVGDATGISYNNRETITNNSYYNLQGLRVQNPARGIYISGGKKTIVK